MKLSKILVGVALGATLAVLPVNAKADPKPTEGCVWVDVYAYDRTGQPFSRVPQFNYILDGKHTVGNSGFTNGVAHEHWYHLSLGKHTFKAIIPAGWHMIKPFPKSPLWVRGTRLHKCTVTTLSVKMNQVPTGHQTVSKGGAKSLPDTGPTESAAGILGGSSLFAAAKAYLKSRKGLLGAIAK